MRKHDHYFKDVTHLSEVDVYRFCDLYKVDDPSGATQHAIKKLLLPGARGAKDRIKDLQEACDTIQRRIEMLKEDAEKLYVMGIPAQVADGPYSCDSLEKLDELRHCGATSVIITPRLRDELKSYQA